MSEEKETENLDIEIDENADNPFKSKEEEVKTDEVKEDINPEKADNDSLKEDYDKLNSQYIRLAADFDNYRKRQVQEREQLLKYGLEEALKKMILVMDNFDRAQKSLTGCEDYAKYKEAFELLQKQVLDELTKLGMEQIEAEGKEFDPNLHEAVMQTPSNEHPEHTIIQELQKGYKLGDKVLRPAMVNVAVQE